MKSLRLSFASLLLLAACALPCAAQAPGFTLEQVLSSPFPTDLVAARRGSRVAWVFDAEGRRNVWVAEGPHFRARQLTRYDRDDGRMLRDLSFSADGDRVVFVRGIGANRAGELANPASDPEGGRQEVLAADWETGQVRVLGDGEGPAPAPAGPQVVFSNEGQLWVATPGAAGGVARKLFQARGSNGSPRWSPDGRLLAFVSNRGDHSFVGVYDTVKKSINFVSPSVDRDSNPRWSPDGRRLAFVRRPTNGGQPSVFLGDEPDPWAIMVADYPEGSAREVWRSGRAANDSAPPSGEEILQWGADGRLVFVSEQDGWRHLYSVPSAGGRAEPLTRGECEVEHVAYTPDRTKAVYSSNCGDVDRRHLFFVGTAGGSPRQLTAGEGIEWGPVVTGDGLTLVYLGSDARSPAMPHAMQFSLAGGSPRMLAAPALPRDFPSPKLVAPQQVVVKAEDGVEVHCQLFLPTAARAGAKLPAVIFVHGGPSRQMLLGWHYMHYYHLAYGFNQYLAGRGYAVLSVNFRSGTGYGRAFRQAPKRGARGASEYQDVLAAARYLRGRSDVDDERVGLWGGSYGGYLTALGLARDSDLFAAGVDIHGVHDWSQRISAASWIDYNSRDAQKVAFEASPVGSVEKWRSPVLLVHGDDDRNVAFAQTTDLARRLRERGVEFEQLVFPDDVHDFLLHRNWLRAYAAASDFLDRHLKGQKR